MKTWHIILSHTNQQLKALPYRLMRDLTVHTNTSKHTITGYSFICHDVCEWGTLTLGMFSFPPTAEAQAVSLQVIMSRNVLYRRGTWTKPPPPPWWMAAPSSEYALSCASMHHLPRRRAGNSYSVRRNLVTVSAQCKAYLSTATNLRCDGVSILKQHYGVFLPWNYSFYSSLTCKGENGTPAVDTARPAGLV